MLDAFLASHPLVLVLIYAVALVAAIRRERKT